MDIKNRIEELREQLRYHSIKYYVYDSPEISDFEYDAMFDELKKLEEAHPEYDSPTSPTKRVGGAVLDKFETAWAALTTYSLTKPYRTSFPI